jgi:hypothetical protein
MVPDSRSVTTLRRSPHAHADGDAPVAGTGAAGRERQIVDADCQRRQAHSPRWQHPSPTAIEPPEIADSACDPTAPPAVWGEG